LEFAREQGVKEEVHIERFKRRYIALFYL